MAIGEGEGIPGVGNWMRFLVSLTAGSQEATVQFYSVRSSKVWLGGAHGWFLQLQHETLAYLLDFSSSHLAFDFVAGGLGFFLRDYGAA